MDPYKLPPLNINTKAWGSMQYTLKNCNLGLLANGIIMNRLAVSRSARAQQAHKVDNRIDRLLALHKTDTDTQRIWDAYDCVI